MTPNERVLDDAAFTPVGATPPAPQSLGALIVDLELTGAADSERRRGLVEWLIHNEPSTRLIRSFERRGCGDLLVEAAASR